MPIGREAQGIRGQELRNIVQSLCLPIAVAHIRTASMLLKQGTWIPGASFSNMLPLPTVQG